MHSVTVLWSMVAAACLTVAAVYGLVWFHSRSQWDRLLFAGAAAGTAGLAFCELWMMRAETTAGFNTAVRWLHVPTLVVMVSLTGLVRLHLKAGRLWLAKLVVVVRLGSLAVNFLMPLNLNYREVSGLRRIPFLGDTVSVADGVPNPWMLLGQLSLLLLVIYVADAAVTVWRRGDRRRAVVEAGSIVFFVLTGSGQAVAALWLMLEWPLMASPWFLGVVAVWGLALSRDTLRASRLAEDLRESQEDMRLAAAAAQLATWTWSPGKDHLSLSPEGRVVYGIGGKGEISLQRFADTLHESDRTMTMAAVRQALQGTGEYAAEYRIVLPDGGLRWIAARGKVEFDRDGQPLRMRGISQDISARKQSEEEAARRRREMEHLSRRATLGEISGAMAHELGQPLGAILANTEAAELHLQQDAPDLEEVRAILADIRADDLRAGEIIHGMRAFLGRGEMQMTALDVAQLAGEAAKLLGADLSSRRIELAMDLPGGLPAVQGSRIHLQQVLVNLLANAMDAVQANPAGERKIILQARLPEPEQVELAVVDSGAGLAPDDELRVFESFHTTKPGGLGLGLPICQSIIAAHRGRITLRNHPEGGAIAAFTLPAAVI